MEQDLFHNLPPEIAADILSRVPLQSTIRCKCVRRSWRSFIESPYFAKAYKSVPSLAVFEGETLSNPYKVYEVEDEINLEVSKKSCDLAFVFTYPHHHVIRTSIHGFLLLLDLKTRPYYLFVYNPLTLERIDLPSRHLGASKLLFQMDSYGFGVSRTSGQYKIVRIFYQDSNTWGVDFESQCQVYTLGTGLWRSVTPASSSLVYQGDLIGAFLNGNLHWPALDVEGRPWISCFDLETETFTTLSPPNLDDSHSHDRVGREVCRTMFASRDCLGICDNSRDEIAIWIMNTYGDEKSWTKQVSIPRNRVRPFFYGYMCVIKVLKDGDVLFKKKDESRILRCSNKTGTVQVTDLIELPFLGRLGRTSAVCYAPSFLRLKTLFPMENVSSF